MPEFFYRGKCCSSCNNTGFKDRIGIFELFIIDEEIENLILTVKAVNDIKKKAISQGMITMEQDGVLKVISGITTIEEVQRVTRE